MKPEYKKYAIIAGVVLLLVIVGVFVFGRSKPQKQETSILEPNTDVLPTVDSSVKVELKTIKKGEASLTVDDAPGGTNLIEYELSYLVVNNDFSGDEGEGGTVSQGAIGKCYLDKGSWECGEPGQEGRKIVLGTCSSGVCRYHNITGPIKVYLKFTGDYGSKSFEKEFTL